MEGRLGTDSKAGARYHLTDINMPQLNGIQLASLVRETYPQVHLVF